jgi:hypothetical protein
VFGLLLFWAIMSKKYGWAGIFWALGFLTKQTGFWFIFPAGIFLLGNLVKAGGKFIKGALGVFAFTIVILSLAGILSDFVFWALKFGIGILPGATGQVQLPQAREIFSVLFPFSLLLVALYADWKRYLVLVLWAVFGILGVFPRWELFHFQPGLPYLAFAVSIFFLERKHLGKIASVIIFIYLVYFGYQFSQFVSREYHKPDTFIEPSVIETAEFVKANTRPGEKIFVLNSWDNFYSLADRLPSSKPWYPQLSWYFSVSGVEQNIIDDLTLDPPSLIVMSPYTNEGLSSFKPEKLTNYILRYYQTSVVFDDKFIVLTPNQ